MSRDLLEFATLFGQGVGKAAEMVDRNQMARMNAQRWMAQQQRLMMRDRVNAGKAADYHTLVGSMVEKNRAMAGKYNRSGVGTGGGVDPIVQGATDAAARQGVQIQPTQAAPAAPVVNVEPPMMVPTPPSDDSGSDGDTSTFRRGGAVRQPVYTGTSGPGSGFGDRAVPPDTLRRFARAGAVRMYADGGNVDGDQTAPVRHNPLRMTTERDIKRVDVGAERAKGTQRSSAERELASRRDASAEPSSLDAGIPIRGANLGTQQVLPESGTAGPDQSGGSDPTMPTGGTSGAAASTEPGFVPTPGVAAATPPQGGAALPTRWRGLTDQSRTAAFDPQRDEFDPDNVHAVNYWGQTNTFASNPAAMTGAIDTSRGLTSGEGLNPQGSAATGAGLSTNDVARDTQVMNRNVTDFATRLFHLNVPDQHSAQGYKALLGGAGTPTPPEVEAVMKAVDPHGQLPPDQRMHLATQVVHDWWMSENQPEKAVKSAFEMTQFGNKMAKTHGAAAVHLAQQGDIQGAAHQLVAGYNWLPDGHRAQLDQTGQNFVIQGPDGSSTTMPASQDTVKNLALGMASGQLGWDVMRSRAAPPQQGTPPPQQGQGDLPSTVSQPTAQPSAAPVGPAAQPSAATPTPTQPAPSVPPPTGQVPSPPASARPSPPAPSAATADPFVPQTTTPVRRTDPIDVEARLRDIGDPNYTKDIAELNSYLARTNKTTRPIVTNLLARRQALHNDRMRDVSQQRNIIAREQTDNDNKEKADLEADKGILRDSKGDVDAAISARINDYIAAANGKKNNLGVDQDAAKRLVGNSMLAYADRTTKQEPLLAAAKNIYAFNLNRGIDVNKAVDIALQMTAHDGKSPITAATFKPVGLNLNKNVEVDIKMGGSPYRVQMPRATYNDLLNAHHATFKTLSKVAADKKTQDEIEANRTRSGTRGALDVAQDIAGPPAWSQSTKEQEAHDPVGSFVKRATGVAAKVLSVPERVKGAISKKITQGAIDLTKSTPENYEPPQL